MFTYKFEGLDAADCPTHYNYSYTYASLPAKPNPGHVLAYNAA